MLNLSFYNKVEGTLNSIKYFYYSSPVHNKINSIVQIIDSISDLQSVVVVVLKNKQSVLELKKFLCTKGIMAHSIFTKEDFDKNQSKKGIFIIIPEVVSYFEQKLVDYLISPFVSLSHDEMKRKISYFKANHAISLIEIIGKNDFSVLQSFYKFPEITVTSFDLASPEKIRENRLFRLSQLCNSDYLQSDMETISEDLVNVLNTVNIQSLQRLIGFSIFAEIPHFEFFYPAKKETKKITVFLNQGSVDGITPQKMKAYLLSLEGMSFENIANVEIKENASEITIISKQFSKDDLVNYFNQKLFFDVKLEISTINEEIVEQKSESDDFQREKSRFGKNFENRENPRYREDRQGYRERRDYNKDGSSFEKRRDFRRDDFGQKSSFDRDGNRSSFRRSDRPFDKNRYDNRRGSSFSRDNYQKPYDNNKNFDDASGENSSFNKFDKSGENSSFNKFDKNERSDFKKKRPYQNNDSHYPKREFHRDNKRDGHFNKEKHFSQRKNRDFRFDDSSFDNQSFKKDSNDKE